MIFSSFFSFDDFSRKLEAFPCMNQLKNEELTTRRSSLFFRPETQPREKYKKIERNGAQVDQNHDFGIRGPEFWGHYSKFSNLHRLYTNMKLFVRWLQKSRFRGQSRSPDPKLGSKSNQFQTWTISISKWRGRSTNCLERSERLRKGGTVQVVDQSPFLDTRFARGNWWIGLFWSTWATFRSIFGIFSLVVSLA